MFTIGILWINSHSPKLSEKSIVALNNIEAIAAGETGDTIPCWSYLTPMAGSKVVDCENCSDNDGYRPMGAVGICIVH